MKKGMIALCSVGATALVLIGGAQAKPPAGISFDTWTVSGGDVTIDCPSGFDCSATIGDKGFYQDMVTSTDGSVQYFRTIVTEKNAYGAAGSNTVVFSDESYVSAKNSNGIADMSYLNERITTEFTDHTLVEDFLAKTEVATGWAATELGTDEIEIYQAVIANDTVKEDFRMDFYLHQKGADGDKGKSMKITEEVEIKDNKSSNQYFVLVEKSGLFNTESGAVNDLGGDASNDLTWDIGEDVQAVWISQEFALPGLHQKFGYESYENKTDKTFIDTYKLGGGTLAPEKWDSSFWGDWEPPIALPSPFTP